MKRLRPEFQLVPVSQQSRGCCVKPKRPERNLFHLAPSRYITLFDIPNQNLDALLTSVLRSISQNTPDWPSCSWLMSAASTPGREFSATWTSTRKRLRSLVFETFGCQIGNCRLEKLTLF
jgi:hypothetical protein